MCCGVVGVLEDLSTFSPLLALAGDSREAACEALVLELRRGPQCALVR